MKTRLGFTATAIGAGLALCNPVGGAIVVGAGLVSAARGIAKMADDPGVDSPAPTGYQVGMLLSAIATGFASLFFIGTIFCAEACSITHGESVLASGLFFGAMCISLWQCLADDRGRLPSVDIQQTEAEQTAWRASLDTQPQLQLPVPVRAPTPGPLRALPQPTTVELPVETATTDGQHWIVIETSEVSK